MGVVSAKECYRLAFREIVTLVGRSFADNTLYAASRLRSLCCASACSCPLLRTSAPELGFGMCPGEPCD